MPTTSRTTLWIVVCALVASAIIFGAVASSNGTRNIHLRVIRSGVVSTKICRNMNSLPDSTIYECLNNKMRVLEVRMTSALHQESKFLSFTSKSEGWRVAIEAQRAFMNYAHHECLAEANPYESGTIVPIIYGECALSLEMQRLTLIQEQTRYFRNGALASTAS